jgi:S1-C subfamily serine protease
MKKIYLPIFILGIIFGIFLIVKFNAVENINAQNEVKVEKNVVNLQEAFVKIAEEVGKAVVHVGTERKIKYRYFDPFEEFDEFFELFGIPRRRSQPQEFEYPITGLGSGMIIEPDGHILTNYHVIRDIIEHGKGKIKVKLYEEEKEYEAKVVGYDRGSDIAIIKISVNKPLPTVKFGDSDKVRVGEWAIAIGNPFGYDNSVTVGIISAKHRRIKEEEDEGIGKKIKDLIQTDAAINPGNSGGPLLNIYGEVIGVNVKIAVGGAAQSAGVGFAIPINEIKKILPKLKKGEKVEFGEKKPYIGIGIDKISQEIAERENVKYGVVITQVYENSPAEYAGLKEGDVIIAIDGKKVETPEDLIKEVKKHSPDDKIVLTIVRNKKERKIKVTLAASE